MAFFTELIGSLLHPALMSGFVAGWVYTAALGIQVRRRRLSGDTSVPLLDTGAQTMPMKGKRHHKLSSALFAFTVSTTFLGMMNTYSRTGRLFPGPHLYVGGVLISLLSFSVALVPHMRSVELTRSIHAAVGTIAILLIFWQVASGVPILGSLLTSLR